MQYLSGRAAVKARGEKRVRARGGGKEEGLDDFAESVTG